MLISIMKKFTGGKDLIRPGVTKFATAYLTLTCLHENKSGLMRMFSSSDRMESKFASTSEGENVQNMALDSRLWKNIVICLKAAAPLITVLRLVDSDEKPAMGFISDAMRSAKEKIKGNCGQVKKSYFPVLNIIDERLTGQLHRPLHDAAYYLNPHFHYDSTFNADDADVKQGLYNCLAKLVSNQTDRNKISLQLPEYHYGRGLFGLDTAKSSRKTMLPAEWWDFYGDGCPELKKFAIRVLSLTCSSSECERNWSAFEMVHTKKRNCLHQKKMNDLVYVIYNLKLKGKQIKRNSILPFDDIHYDDEWITSQGNVDDGYDGDDEGDQQQPPLNDTPIPIGSWSNNETNMAGVGGIDQIENVIIGGDDVLEDDISMNPIATAIVDLENLVHNDIIVDEDANDGGDDDESDDIGDVGGFDF